MNFTTMIMMVVIAFAVSIIIFVIKSRVGVASTQIKQQKQKSLSRKQKKREELPEDWDNSNSSVQIRRRRTNIESVNDSVSSDKELVVTLLIDDDDDDDEVYDFTKKKKNRIVQISLLDDIDKVTVIKEESTEIEEVPLPPEEMEIEVDNKVMERLNLLHLRLSKNRIEVEGDTDNLQIVYSDDAPPVTINNGYLGLKPMRVYAEGLVRNWDEYAEVKLPANKMVEIEFGVGFKFASKYKMILEPVGNLADKFALRFAMESVEMKAVDAQVPLLLKMMTSEGSYVSKSGILFDAHLEEQPISISSGDVN